MAVIWWMRRDMRLSDNMALYEALATGEPVVPVFVADPQILKVHNMGAARMTFCFDSVRDLDQRLRQAKAGYVVIRYGDPLEELSRIAKDVKASTIFFNRDYSPLALKRDERVAQGLTEEGIDAVSFKDLVIWEEGEILSQSGQPYSVFTAYLRQWEALTPPPVVGPAYPDIPDFQTPDGITCDELPTLEDLGLPPAHEMQPAGEVAAQERMAEWFDLRSGESVAHYRENRNLPALNEGTSRLSPHIRFGTVSVRTLYALARDAGARTTTAERRKSIDLWISELAWRDFYYQALFHYPRIHRGAFVKKYNRLKWSYEEDAFAAWQAGLTGYPYIDAAMRELHQSGFMHNRARMAVANFLTKDLLVDWRRGYDHFMRLLTDGDPASNNGGWQWAASTGPSAQPYFRVFNPTSQGKKHDPDGMYIRKWVPELRRVPTRLIHEPWRMSPAEQREAGCMMGTDYPLPIVDHEDRRERALAMYKAVEDGNNIERK
jgi:deoxyribodipyrimidine photo-lyase